MLNHKIIFIILQWFTTFSETDLSYELLFITESSKAKENITKEYLNSSVEPITLSLTTHEALFKKICSMDFRLIQIIDRFNENFTRCLRFNSMSITLSFRPFENLSSLYDMDIGNNLYFIKQPTSIFQRSLIHEFRENYSVKVYNRTEKFNLSYASPKFVFDIDTITQLENKIHRRLDFLGAIIIGVSELKKDLVEVDESGKVVFLGGYNVVEYRYLRDFLNFTEATIPWRGYVSQNQNRELLGMGQQVNNGEADISIQSQEILLYRAEKLTFLVPNINNIETLYAFFKQSSSTFIKNPYFKVFKTDAWTIYILIWGIIGLTIWTGKVILSSSHENDINSTSTSPSVSSDLFDTWSWIIGTICQQGIPLKTNVYHIKIILIVSLFFSYFIFQVFNSSLVAVLSHPNELIHSFSDILQYEFQLFNEKDTNNAYDFLLDLRRKGQTQQVFNKSIHAVSAEDGLRYVQKGKAAFVSPIYLFYPKLPQTYSFANTLCQTVSKVKVEGFTTRSAMFIKKDSPYKEYFFYTLMRMAEFGVRDRLSKKFRVSGVTLRCLEDIKRNPDPVKFEDTVSNMILIVTGLVFGFFILLLELSIKNWKYSK